jgi:hypothetical protein
MKNKTLILIFFLLSAKIFSQNQVLPELDLKNKEYEFYIFNDLFTINEDGNSLEPKKTLITDKSIISNLINTWKGEKTNDMYKCGYDYKIYIVLDDKIIEQVNFNSECNQVVSSKGTFNVTNNPFKQLTIENVFSEYKFSTKDINLARKFVNKVSENKKIQIPYLKSYEWIKYNGYFFIQINKEKKLKKLKPTEFYEKEMHKIYSEYDFHVRFWGFGGTYEAWIYCDKSLHEKFNLYGRKGEFENIKPNYEVYVFGKVEDINAILNE